MEEEHCLKAGCDDEFVSSNYGVRTTPRKEYEIATWRRACPPEDMLDRKGQAVRNVRRIEELKELKLVRKAGLEDVEIFAVVSMAVFPPQLGSDFSMWPENIQCTRLHQLIVCDCIENIQTPRAQQQP
jgi:hypothetical protein